MIRTCLALATAVVLSACATMPAVVPAESPTVSSAVSLADSPVDLPVEGLTSSPAESFAAPDEPIDPTAKGSSDGQTFISSSNVRTLYFGNLPWAVTAEDLTNAVQQYCEVSSARIATDVETGRSRGFGFVDVPADMVDTVINALNGADWGGRPLTVIETRPRQTRPSPSPPG